MTPREAAIARSQRTMTRRRVLASAVAAGSVGLGTAACGGSAPKTQPRALASTPTPTGPQRGGILRSIGGPLTGVPDPHTTSSTVDARIWQWCGNLLFRFSAQAPHLPEPDLAASLPEQPGDGVTFVVKIRPEAKWQDLPPVSGRLVSAHDVKASFDRMKAVGVNSPRAGNYANIDRVTVVDEHTLQFKLKAPQADLLNVLSDQFDIILPQELAARGNDAIRSLADVIGSGPYQLTRYEPGLRVQLTRRTDGYWRKPGAWVDGLELLDIEDAGQAANLLLEGVADEATFPPVLARVFAEQANFSVLRAPSAARECVLVNHRAGPWRDPRVRLAAWRAIDRQLVYSAAFQGEGVPGGPVSPAAAAWALSEAELASLPGFGERATEVSNAKALLTAAGFKDGFDDTILTVSSLGLDRVNDVVVRGLAQAGIRLTTQDLGPDISALTGRARSGTFSLMTTLLLAGIYPDAQLSVYHRSGGAANFGGYSNTALDAKLDRQHGLYDEVARTALVRDIQRDIVRAPGPLWLGSRNQLKAVSARVHGMVATPFVAGYSDAENCWLG